MSRKVILDVDTGSDDAIAIMLAALHPNIDLVAVTTVKGNLPLDNVTENTKKVLDLLNSSVPLYKGCSTSIVKDVCPWRRTYENRATIIDEDGKPIFVHQDFTDLKSSNREIEDKPASVFLSEYFNDNKATLVCTGPLTNLATALLINPNIVNNIDELVIMGGGDNEANATSSAEFNFFFDPEAAQKVFQSEFNKITLCPLDITHKLMVTKDDVKKIEEIGTSITDFAVKMCNTRIKMHSICQPLELPDACTLHDPLTIAYLIDPSVLTDVRNLHIDISLSGLSEGSSIVDHRYFQDNRNVFIAYNGNRNKFIDILVDAFKRSC